MSADTLTPKLTALDQRVLAMLPIHSMREWRCVKPDALSAHQVAERLGTDDVKDTRSILAGLEHLRYVWSVKCRARKVVVYWRRPEDERW